MLQILPRAQSNSDRFARAFSNLSSTAAQEIPQELMGRQERSQMGGLIGEDIGNIRNPDFLKQIVSTGLRKKEEEQKLARDKDLALEDYKTIEKHFGKDAADLYKSFTTGGQTKLANAFVDSLLRGEKFNNILGGGEFGEGGSQNQSEQPNFDFANASGQEDIGNKIQSTDFTIKPKGFTPQEWAKERKEWTKKNTESLESARDKLRSNKRDVLGTKKLNQLNESEDMPDGLERWMINPNTGEPYKSAQLIGKVPTVVQEWVKEVARFGNRAKDAYGSRVTNFDLAQYLKQFPNLLNTYEGRKNILKMMEINYQLDALYDTAVQQILDSKGAGNIPPAEVDRVARSMIKQKEDELFDQYLSFESENESSFLNEGTKRQSLEEIFG